MLFLFFHMITLRLRYLLHIELEKVCFVFVWLLYLWFFTFFSPNLHSWHYLLPGLSRNYFISFWNEINEDLLWILPLLHLIIFYIFIHSLLLSCIYKKRIIPNTSLQVSPLHLSSVSVFCFFLQILDPSVLPHLQIFLVFFQTKSFPSTSNEYGCSH